jgi:hypothetical protein
MLRNADQKAWVDNYEQIVGGRNKLIFKHFTAAIDGVRMSGEMDTSLSNGFSNLMFFLFLTHENSGSADGFVEGDDGLFRVTPPSAAPTKEQFARLGLTIKIETTKVLSEASFCGQVYDMDELIVVTDPLETLARVGFTNKRYVKANKSTRMQLLRAKGFSLAYQYAGCPLLQELGHRILHLTKGVEVSQRVIGCMDQWEKQKLELAMKVSAVKKEIGQGTRALVEKLYGVTVEQQFAIEKRISTLQLGLHPMPLMDLCDPSWTEYYERYHFTEYDTDPCWLLRGVDTYLDRLSKFQNLAQLVESVR